MDICTLFRCQLYALLMTDKTAWVRVIIFHGTITLLKMTGGKVRSLQFG